MARSEKDSHSLQEKQAASFVLKYRLFDGLEEVMACRELLCQVLNENNLVGEGAEVGVQRGAFSAEILTRWKGRKLYSIDPWRHFPQEEYPDCANKGQEEQDEIYAEARRRLAPFAERSEIVRRTSSEAAPLFADGQLDFVYIDAQHHYEAVAEDIALWYPKVKPGGIVGGHDYFDGEIPDVGVFGVKKAVQEFARRGGHKVVTTGLLDEKGLLCLPSWFIVKPFNRA